MRERTCYLDIARVVSMICVIAIHVGAISWYDPPYEWYPWFVYNAWDCVSRFCVPVFLMISGCIFLDPGRDITPKKLYTKYIPRILAAYFFWSALYAVISSGFVTQRVLSKEVVQKFGESLIFGHYHQWYLYIILGLYLVTPALRAVAANEEATRYFLILSGIVGYLIPTLQQIPVLKGTVRYTERIDIAVVTGYIFYYLFGYYIGGRTQSKNEVRIWYLIGLLGLIATCTLTYLTCHYEGYPDIAMHEYGTIHVALYSCGVFVFFKNRFASVDPSSRIMKVVFWLSKLSFAIYLAHDFGLIVFRKIGFVPASFNAFLSMPILILLDLIISVAIAYCASKIPKWNKYIC